MTDCYSFYEYKKQTSSFLHFKETEHVHITFNNVESNIGKNGSINFFNLDIVFDNILRNPDCLRKGTMQDKSTTVSVKQISTPLK